MKKIIKWSGLILALVVLISLFYYVKEKKNRPHISSDELLRMALLEIREHKNYPRAIELTREALVISPGYADIQVTLGRAFMLNGNIDSAKANLEKALIKDKKNEAGLLYLVNINIQERDTIIALRYLDQYLGFYPTDKDTWLKKYILLLQYREYTKATAVYNFYTSRFDPDTIRTISFDYWKLLGASAHKKGELAMAFESYQKAFRIRPGESEVLQQLVNLAMHFNNYPSALKYNKVLLKQDTANRMYLITASTIYQKIQDNEHAALYAAKAYSLYPSDIITRKNLVALYLSLTKDEVPSTKIRYATLALQVEPAQKEALLYLINAHLELHQYIAALNTTNRSLGFYPSDQVFIDKKIGILYDMGNYQACADYLESVLRQRPTIQNIRAYDDVEGMIASGFSKQQKWDDALAAIQKGLLYNKNNKALLEQLANIYASQNKISDAIVIMDQLLLLNPNHDTYLFKKAGLLAVQHQFESAAIITGTLYRKHPDVTEYKNAYLDQLLGAEKSGITEQDWDKAIHFYNNAATTGNPGYFQLLYAMTAYAGKGDSLHVLALTDTALTFYPNDSLFLIKRSLAFGNILLYPEALTVSRKLLKRYPSDTTLQKMYLDQLYTAGKYYEKENKNDSALNTFFTAYAFAPKDTFALMNLSAIYFVKKRYDSSIYYANMGLQLDSNNEYLLMKKASAYEVLKQYGYAFLSANRLRQLHPSKKNSDYADYLKGKTYKNQIGISYLHSFFPSSSQYASLTGIQYMRRFEKGSITAKLNYGDRYAGTGVQAGFDAYYTHDSTYYSNFFINRSTGIVFPYWQAGYSLFRNFKKGWEAELGARYLGFDSLNNYTAMASIGKYIKSTWLNLRGFYTYNTKKGYPSYQLTARQYLNDKNDYLSAIAGLGSIPDDQSLNYNFNNFSGFVSKSVGIGFQKNFRYKTTFQAFFNYTNLQVAPIKTLNQYDVYLTLFRNF